MGFLSATNCQLNMFAARDIPTFPGEAGVHVAPEDSQSGVALRDGVRNPVGRAREGGLLARDRRGRLHLLRTAQPQGDLAGSAHGGCGEVSRQNRLPIARAVRFRVNCRVANQVVYYPASLKLIHES